MSDKPTPLREALREAVENLMVICYVQGQGGASGSWVTIEEAYEFERVAALIEQIPIVFEAREVD